MKNRSLKSHSPKTTTIRDTKGKYHVCDQDTVIKTAVECINRRFQHGCELASSEQVREFLQLRFRNIEYEVFLVIYLDNQNRLIEVDEAFVGTFNGAAVYPREIMKTALYHNAAAVILAHNHPSGSPEPSQSDRDITQRLVSALDYIDVKVLDHFVVGESVVSFAERRLI